MGFAAIIIGDEILSGKRADKHLAKAIELLGNRGLQVAYADYVGDDPERITGTLQRAFASGDVVSLYNTTSGSLAITQGSGLTLRFVGTANTGSRTLSGYGLVTVMFI